MDWELLSYVKASKHRENVLRELSDDGTMTPKELSDNLDIHLSQASKVLTELQSEGLIKCMTPDKRKGKLYRTTEEGLELRANL